MKKILVLITLLVISMSQTTVSFGVDPWDFNTEPYYCSIDYSEELTSDQIEICELYDSGETSVNYDYSYAVENSQYDRIEKDPITGIWSGVIFVDVSNIFNIDLLNTGLPFQITHNYSYFVEFAFTRETIQLYEITLDYEVPGYCPAINCWFTSNIPAVSDRKVLIYDENSIGLDEAKNIDEVFGDGSITKSIDNDYDYVLKLDVFTRKDLDIHVDLISFWYVLTDDEVIDLRLDIQAQYENEVEFISRNPLISFDEKKVLFALVEQEYLEYTIDFGELLNSYCEGDGCSIDYDGTDDSSETGNLTWWEELFELIKKLFVGKTLGEVIVIMFVILIAIVILVN